MLVDTINQESNFPEETNKRRDGRNSLDIQNLCRLYTFII